MPVKQGDLGLLQHPVSVELLQSRIPARLAYVWMDGNAQGYPHLVPLERTGVRDGDSTQSAET